MVSTVTTDKQVLTAVDLTVRYRMMTPTALCTIRSSDYRCTDSAKCVLENAASASLLGRAALYGDRKYYFKMDESVSVGLSETAKIRNYAMMLACVSSNRTRLDRRDFTRYFPDLCRRGLPMNYYVDLAQNQPVLGFFRIDTGGRGRWDRIVAKALDDARRHKLEPSMKRFLDRNAFEVRIVTSLPQKVDRIRRELESKSNPFGIPVCVTAVPELLNLVAPIPRNIP